MANIFSNYIGQCSICGYPLDNLGKCTSPIPHGDVSYTTTGYMTSPDLQSSYNVSMSKQNNLLIRFINIYDHLTVAQRNYVKSLISSFNEDHYIMIDAFLNAKTSEILK